jgi:hypothetical protein
MLDDQKSDSENNKIVQKHKTSCAFAVVAPKDKTNKEFILILRGTKSLSDWSINLNDDKLEFTYLGNDGNEVKGTEQYVTERSNIQTTYDIAPQNPKTPVHLKLDINRKSNNLEKSKIIL